ncbi:MAG: ATP-binding cassette domain-containing protein [Alistipes sp.]|jgi:cell division transport system ATP-binding protein|nr:ATP-binding cassette domain-containing protein [Alistipes sp.]
MGKRVIELRGVSIYHGEAAKSTNSENDLILSNIDLAVDEGEFVYLIGRVGTGKSTLLKTLYAEVEPASGSAEVVGFDLCNLKRRQIPELRRALGIVFQDFQLLTDRNVFLNLYDVMRATGWRKEEDIRRRIEEVLTLVGLEHKSYKMPFELSGGEQQRLTIARALVNSPRLILADEPTGNLDPVTAEGIMELFHKIAQSGCAVVMSTHNISLIEQYPSRTILFAKGGIAEVDVKELL